MNLKPIEQALERLKAVFPDADNVISFEVTHYGRHGITTPCFYANSDGTYLLGRGGKTPNHAVNNLLKTCGITRVEEYVRTKAREAKQVRA